VSQNETRANLLIKYNVKVDRNVDYLAETSLDDTQKITPNFYLFVFAELENSASGSDIAQARIFTYQHFVG
jgi:hypothetical protein